MYLCTKIIKDYDMCTVSVKVDEAVLRDVMPELDSNAAIRLWVQKLVDMHLQQLRGASERDLLSDDDEAIDLETFRADLHRMIEEVYAEP